MDNSNMIMYTSIEKTIIISKKNYYKSSGWCKKRQWKHCKCLVLTTDLQEKDKIIKHTKDNIGENMENVLKTNCVC